MRSGELSMVLEIPPKLRQRTSNCWSEVQIEAAGKDCVFGSTGAMPQRRESWIPRLCSGLHLGWLQQVSCPLSGRSTARYSQRRSSIRYRL
jgi:hypothetical protein